MNASGSALTVFRKSVSGVMLCAMPLSDSGQEMFIKSSNRSLLLKHLRVFVISGAR